MNEMACVACLDGAEQREYAYCLLLEKLRSTEKEG